MIDFSLNGIFICTECQKECWFNCAEWIRKHKEGILKKGDEGYDPDFLSNRKQVINCLGKYCKKPCKYYDKDGADKIPREVLFNAIEYLGNKIHELLKEKYSKSTAYQAIDLGLPSGLLWANKNIGAETEVDAGLYFQWGDIQGYTAEQIGTDKRFDWTDYKWGTVNVITKYNDTGLTKDDLTTLESADDAATQIMGSDWRMPTRDEFIELVENTDVYFISTNGNEVKANYTGGCWCEFTFPVAETMKGMKFYNKSDHSKYIFAPASGVADDGSVHGAGVGGYLWSSSLYVSNGYAWDLRFYAFSGYGFIENCSRFYGLGVRGVKK